MKLRPIIALRHDVDSVLGLYGLRKVIEVEGRLGVKSSIYIRASLLRKCTHFLKQLVKEGWRVGLHLDNSIDDLSPPSPREELELVENVVGSTASFTVHGRDPRYC